MKEMDGTFAKMRGGGDKFQCVVKQLGQMFDMRIKEERQYKTDGTVIVQGFPIANWEFKK